MAAKSTTGKTDIDLAREMFAGARNVFVEMTGVHADLCVSLAQAKRALTVQEEAIFLYEANSVLDGTINDGANERERKYLLAQWKNDDAHYIEHVQDVTRFEQDVERLTREVELIRFRISAVKRSIEFAVAWMHAIGAAA